MGGRAGVDVGGASFVERRCMGEAGEAGRHRGRWERDETIEQGEEL